MKRKLHLAALFFPAVGVLMVLMAALWIVRGRREWGEGARLTAAGRPSSAVIQGLAAEGTREATAREVGRRKDRTAVPLLRGFTKDPDPAVRRACVWALGEIGDPEAVYAMRLRIGTDKDVAVRLAATEALAKLGRSKDPTIVNTLVDALEDRDEGVRMAAVRGLAGIPWGAATEGLIVALGSERPRAMRMAAVEGLGLKGREAPVEALGRALNDTDAGIRLGAMKSLGTCGDEAAFAHVARALNDPDASVRGMAIQAVKAIGPPVFGELKGMLPRARYLEVRLAAAELLATLDTPDSDEALLRLLDGADRLDTGALRDSVVKALAVRGERMLGTLVKLAVEGEMSPGAEEAAAELLKRIGKPAARPIAETVARRRLYLDPVELRLWLKTLGEIGDPSAAGALNAALAQPIDDIERAVAEARTAIERKSGLAIPVAAAKPAPAVGARDVARRPTARRLADAPATTPTNRVPDEGVVALTLRRAIYQPWASQERGGCDVQIHLERHGGEWLAPCWGHGFGFNVRHHAVRVTGYEAGDPAIRLKLEMAVLEDEWVPGGFAEYDVRLSRDGTVWRGTYEGHLNYQPLKGNAVATGRRGAILDEGAVPVGAGEHPRLLFRVEDIPVMRARAATDFGQAIVRALRARAGGSKGEDWRGDVDPVQTWETGMDRVVGMAGLALLYDDPDMGRRAARAFMPRVRIRPYMGEHGEAGGPRIHAYGFGFDMTWPFLTEAEREEARQDLGTFWSFIRPEYGMMANMTGGSPPGGYTIPAPGVFAMLREKGPLRLRPAREPHAVTIVPAETPPPASDGLTPMEFASGSVLTNWIVNGPFETNLEASLLAELGGPEKAQPREGTVLTVAGGEYAFLRLPQDAVRPTPGFGGKPGVILLPAARSGSHSFLYGLARVRSEQGVLFDCRFPARYESARVWIGGREVGDRCLLILQPGLHRILIEVVGAACSPVFTEVNGRYLLAQQKKDEWKRAEYEAARAHNEKSGELAGPPLMAGMTRRALRDLARVDLERSLARGTPGTGLFWSTMNGYANVYGEPMHRDVPLPYAVRPEFLGMASDEDLCVALLLAPEATKPFVVHEFNRRFPPGNLGRLTCRALLTALANYPMDVTPRAMNATETLTRVEEDVGRYSFRSATHDFTLRVFGRTAWPNAPVAGLPRAGTFALALGQTDWIREHPQHLNVVAVDGSAGGGLGKLTHYSAQTNGSGSLSLDLSEAYNDGKPLGVRVSRYLAVDYSGQCGASVLLAVLDRVSGEVQKTSNLYVGFSETNRVGNVFTVGAPQVRWGGRPTGNWTMRGMHLSPDDAPMRTDYTYLRKAFEAWRIGSRSMAKEAAFWTVLTIQRGPPPELKVVGKGADAVVTVGGQRVAFDGQKLTIGP